MAKIGFEVHSVDNSCRWRAAALRGGHITTYAYMCINRKSELNSTKN